MAKPGLDDMWLYCAMARRLLAEPGGGLTCKQLAYRIRQESNGTVARNVLWTAKIEVHTLKRCVDKLTRHFGQDLVAVAEDGGLTLRDFGRRVYELFQPVIDDLLRLYGRDPADGPRLVWVHDSLAGDVVPGALARLRDQGRTPDGGPFHFGALDYQAIEEGIRERRVAFGVGWDVAGRRWSALETAAFGPPLGLAFVAAPGAVAGDEPGADDFRRAVRADHPLYVLRDDLQLAGLAAILGAIPRGWVVEGDNARAVLMHARRGDGVGVVPLLPWVLDRLRDRRQVVYAGVPEAGERPLTCYLPRGGEAALAAPARQLLEAIRDNFGQLYQAADFRADRPGSGRMQPPHRGRRRAGAEHPGQP